MKKIALHHILFILTLTLSLAAFATTGVAVAGEPTKIGDDNLGKLHAAQGVKCVDCHGKVKQKQAVSMEKWLECHGDTQKLAEKTAGVKPHNPHENRHYGTEADCNLCHHQHKKSENLCLPCHSRFGFSVP